MIKIKQSKARASCGSDAVHSGSCQSAGHLFWDDAGMRKSLLPCIKVFLVVIGGVHGRFGRNCFPHSTFKWK